jgi:hyperosmotically inducible protein
MKKVIRVALLSLATLPVIGNAGNAQAGEKPSTNPEVELSRAVRKSLERLPYYGVFDILSYQMGENGLVELSGFAFRESLKREAEDAVLNVPGVKKVLNRIEDIDWGVADDEIRAGVYHKIYRDTFLSRYGTATDQALANGVGLAPRGRFGVFGALGVGNPYLPGFNPVGDYGIHIVVSNGEVILMGQVDSEMDRNLAGLKARTVFPVKKVFNELSVKGEEPVQDKAPVRRGKRGFVVDASN